MANVSDSKNQFPIFNGPGGGPLVYLDSAGMAQVPQTVIDRMIKFEANERANIHSGFYHLSRQAGKAYADARQSVADFLNASFASEIVFTKNTTEAINMVAGAWARKKIKSGDVIILSETSHHSNLLPWLKLAEDLGAVIKWAEPGDAINLIDDKVKIIAVDHVSNALGTINPIEEIIKAGHEHGAIVVIDGAQAAPHLPVDVQKLDCDFYAFSGYKIYGPTGIGVLYGKKELLEEFESFNPGGGSVLTVTKKETRWREAPEKLEGGTPNISGAIGLAAALSFMDKIGRQNIYEHERGLISYLIAELSRLPGVTIYGLREAADRSAVALAKAGVVSFNLDKIHPHDVATLLDEQGIAIRAGHHCAGVLMERLGVSATCRVSFGVYNDKEDIDKLIGVINNVVIPTFSLRSPLAP